MKGGARTVRWRRPRRETVLPFGILLLLGVAAVAALAYRWQRSSTNASFPPEDLFPKPFGLKLLSPTRALPLTGAVTIAWTTDKLRPAEVLLRYTSDPLPSCGACPRPTWHVLAQLPGDATSYEWDTTALPPGDYHVEVSAIGERDRQAVYSPVLRINGGKAAGAKGAGRPASAR